MLSLRPRSMAALMAMSAVAAGCTGDQTVEKPAPLYGQISIEYPLELWDRNIEGETLLKVRVTDMGRVDSVEVVTSSGEPAFDSAAIAGARDLRFTPARKNGKRIEVWAQVPVHFSKRPWVP
jgi:periplasmic protein TonB